MANVKCVTCGTENEVAAMTKHDGNFCCVTEGCYVPLMEENNMREFTIEGFNHVTADGIAQLWQYFQMKGTIDMLWDMSPKAKINELMGSANFDMDAHIKTNYGDANYDEVVTDMLDELLETIIILEYCFVFDVYSIDFKGKSIYNLDAIPECDEWNPNTYLPLTCDAAVTNNEVLKDACNWLCDRGDSTNCNYFLSPCPEAGPYAIIHFMEDGVNMPMIAAELNGNFGDVLKFHEQNAHTITAWTKE